MDYQSEITIWTSKKLAKKLKKKIAGCGFVTAHDEVSKRKIVDWTPLGLFYTRLC